MAIIKMVQVRAGKAYGLKYVLDYIQNPAKTQNGDLVLGKDCMVESAFKQMMITKLDYTQNTGRQYVHIIQSFALNDDITPEKAHEIGSRLLSGFDGFQGVVATHTDKNHLHNHIILNSVNWQTGLKWQQSKQDLQALRTRSDNLCREYGLSVIQGHKGWKSYGEYTAEKQGASWKMNLAENVAGALQSCTDIHDFYRQLHEKGIKADFYDTNVVFTDADGHKCGNNKLMAYGDFSIKNIRATIAYNGTCLDNAKNDTFLFYEVCDTVSRMLFPNEPDRLHRCVSEDIPFDALTQKEIERLLLERQTKRLLERTKGLNAQIEQEQKRPDYFLIGMADLLELALDVKRERENDLDMGFYQENDWEYEM